jgi:putative membrane protein
MNMPSKRSGFVTAVTAFCLMGAPAFAQTPSTNTPPPAAQPSPKTANPHEKTPTPSSAPSGSASGTTGTTGSGTTGSGTTGSAAGTTGDPAPADVLTKLHHSNQMEIEAGKLAQEKGQSKGVKDYGKMLVKDHTAADKKVTSVAKQLKVELTAPSPEMKHDKLEKARSLSGAEFDKAFTEAMVEDHKTDVQEATEARDKTTNPQLKKLLTEVVPKLEKHQTQAEKLNTAAQSASPSGTKSP